MTVIRSSHELDDYKSRGFANQMGFGARPALLVVDLSNGFTDPRLPLGSPADDAIAQTNALLDAAHAAAIPVFFSTISYDGPELNDTGVWRYKMDGLSTLKANTRAVEIDDRLHRRHADTIFPKRYASCFFGTDLASRLRHQGIDTLVIVGCSTSGCVRATAVDACQSGLRTVVVREAVTDRSAAAHRQGLVDIEAKYGDVISIEQALAEFAKCEAKSMGADIPDGRAIEVMQRVRGTMRRQMAPIAILATRTKAERAGILVTSVISVSLDPPSVLISINRSSGFYLPVRESRRFSVNWLSVDHSPLVPIFSGTLKGERRFGHGNWSELKGLPILADACATFVCRVEADLQYGSHHIFIGRVEEAVQSDVGTSLLWHEGAPVAGPQPKSGLNTRIDAG